MATKRVNKAAGKVRDDGLRPRIRATRTMSLDSEIYEKAKRMAQDEGVNISNLVDELLKAWVELDEGA